MSQDRIEELIDRFTSRKFLLCVVSLVIFGIGYSNGSLSYEDFSKAVLGAVLTFSVSEGAADAVAAYRPKPSGDTQNVTVGAEVQPPPVVVAPVLAKRVRPSRAKAP